MDSLRNKITILKEFQVPIEKRLFSAETNDESRSVIWKQYSENPDILFIKDAFESLKFLIKI
jgi:hypothetical protein